MKVPFQIESKEFLPRQKLGRASEVNKGEVQLSGENSFYKPDENKSDRQTKMAETQKAFNHSKKTDDAGNIISQIESRDDTALRLSKTSFAHRNKSTSNINKTNPYLSKGFNEGELFSATN